MNSRTTLYYRKELERGDTVLGYTDLQGAHQEIGCTEKSIALAEIEGSAFYVLEPDAPFLVLSFWNDEWKQSQHIYGIGNRNNPLSPLVHVAADQEWYPFGTGIYFRKWKKFCWVADTGGAIKGEGRFDFFIGDDARYAVIDPIFQEEQQGVTVFPIPPHTLSPTIGRDLQIILTEGRRKYYTGKIDGIIGPITRQALVDFQFGSGIVPGEEWGCLPVNAAATLYCLIKYGLDLSA